MASTFTCTLCCEDKPLRPKPIHITHEDVVCRECYNTVIKPKFLAALRNEHEFPFKWGTTVLDPASLPGFTTSFVKQWRDKAKEYEAADGERVYCKQKVLLGSTRALSPRQLAGMPDDMMRECGAFLGVKSETPKLMVCRNCSGRACGSCGGKVRSAIDPHACHKNDAPEDQDDDPFKDMLRGRDYQDCPTCSRRVTLQDGCNSLTCPRGTCATHFCYICGARAPHNSDHWTAPNPCPRWNQPGAENAFQDPPAEALPGLAGGLGAMLALLLVPNALDVAENALGVVDVEQDEGEFARTIDELSTFLALWVQETNALAGGNLPIPGPDDPVERLPMLDDHIEKQTRKRDILHQQANVEQDPTRREIRLDQAALRQAYIDVLETFRYAVPGAANVRLGTLISLITALGNNLEARVLLEQEEVDEEALQPFSVRHTQIRELADAIEPRVWQHRIMRDVFSRYIEWAAGQL